MHPPLPAYFVNAIKAAPDDDAPRLAAADWLDEQAQRRGEDTPCPRAELIRVQVKLLREFPGHAAHPETAAEDWHRRMEGGNCPACKVQGRQQELLLANVFAWLRGDCPGGLPVYHTVGGLTYGYQFAVRYGQLIPFIRTYYRRGVHRRGGCHDRGMGSVRSAARATDSGRAGHPDGQDGARNYRRRPLRDADGRARLLLLPRRPHAPARPGHRRVARRALEAAEGRGVAVRVAGGGGQGIVGGGVAVGPEPGGVKMTVRELMAELSKVDPDRIVVMQSDAEGNGYSPLHDVDDNAGYLAETTWYGDVAKQRLSDADVRAGFGDDDLCDARHVPCLVLAPVN